MTSPPLPTGAFGLDLTDFFDIWLRAPVKPTSW